MAKSRIALKAVQPGCVVLQDARPVLVWHTTPRTLTGMPIQCQTRPRHRSQFPLPREAAVALFGDRGTRHAFLVHTEAHVTVAPGAPAIGHLAPELLTAIRATAARSMAAIALECQPALRSTLPSVM